MIDGDDLVAPGGREADAQDALLALPRMQRHAAAAGAVRVDQFADLAVDPGVVQRVDDKLALPVPIRIRLPVLDRAAAAGAEMRAERIDALRACVYHMRKRAAIRMSG